MQVWAVVSDDGSISGTMVSDHNGGWLDGLSELPLPRDDRTLFRTFPGAPNQGQLEWTEGEEQLTFHAELPRRFGALGHTRHGTFANGAWLPQPCEGDPCELVAAFWEVHVSVPEGSLVGLGDAWGRGQVSWRGHAERPPLAVFPEGYATFVSQGQSTATLLTRRKPRKVVKRELERLLEAHPPASGLVVVAPMRRRLTRPAPGMLYLSDRAFRLTAGLEFAHREAVSNGLLRAWAPAATPFERELIGALEGQVASENLTKMDLDRLLGAFAWVPQINSLLSSRSIPFYADILNLPHPGDPLEDDLAELAAPFTPGAVVLDQVGLRYGSEAVPCWLTATHDAGVFEAAESCAIDLGWLRSWNQHYPRQDYTLDVDDEVRVSRETAPGAPDEYVRVRVGDEVHVLHGAGPWEQTLPVGKRVAFDPARMTSQTSRAGESWPPRYQVTASGWIDTINLSQRLVFGSLFGTLRRQYDTHNLFTGSVTNSQSNLVRVGVGYLRKEGSLQDGWRRPHRISVGLSTALLNPRFASTEGVTIATDTSVGYAHDTRISSDFPMRGHRLGGGVGGGLIPGSTDRWGSVGAHAVFLGPLHPRVVVASRSIGTVARSTVPHRLIQLGGEGAMRSIPVLPACPSEDACALLGTERVFSAAELRVAAIRNASVPVWLAWGSELQLTAGLEGTVANVENEAAAALGATAGILVMGDVLGADAMGTGLTLGWPMVWSNVGHLQPTRWPQIYLRWGQAF